MGIDLVIGGQSKKAKRTSLRSDDVYLKLLVKLYKFLVRGTGRKFNAVILKCLFMSKANKPPISLKRGINFMAGKDQKIELIVGTMTDDKRVYEVPAMNVTALRFTEMVRARIVKAGRECLTLDQLALRAPLAQNTDPPAPVCIWSSCLRFPRITHQEHKRDRRTSSGKSLAAWVEAKVAAGVPKEECELPFLTHDPKMVACGLCRRCRYARMKHVCYELPTLYCCTNLRKRSCH